MKKYIIGASLLTIVIASSAYAATQTIGGGLTSNGTSASGSQSITVNATVDPVMSFTVSGSTVDFGSLNLGVSNTGSQTTDITVSSNGTSTTVIASYTNLARTGEPAVTIPLTINNGANIASGGFVINQGTYSASPSSSSVSYVATPDANQKAGAYSTSVMYTATGNF